MTARCYTSPPPPDEDYIFPADEPTLKIKARCRCGVRAVTNIRMRLAALPLLRLGAITPHLVVASGWCKDCRTLVNVTAKAMHLA